MGCVTWDCDARVRILAAAAARNGWEDTTIPINPNQIFLTIRVLSLNKINVVDRNVLNIGVRFFFEPFLLDSPKNNAWESFLLAITRVIA